MTLDIITNLETVVSMFFQMYNDSVFTSVLSLRKCLSYFYSFSKRKDTSATLVSGEVANIGNIHQNIPPILNVIVNNYSPLSSESMLVNTYTFARKLNVIEVYVASTVPEEKLSKRYHCGNQI